jgi:hypothetical protein
MVVMPEASMLANNQFPVQAEIGFAHILIDYQ